MDYGSAFILLSIPALTTTTNLNPYFFTGFIDAEGCFNIYLQEHAQCKTGWRVQAAFFIRLHKKEKALMELIKAYLGVGRIYDQGDEIRVISIKELKAIVNHLEKYPLITQK